MVKDGGNVNGGIWSSLLQVIQMYTDRLQEATWRYVGVGGDVTAKEKI